VPGTPGSGEIGGVEIVERAVCPSLASIGGERKVLAHEAGLCDGAPRILPCTCTISDMNQITRSRNIFVAICLSLALAACNGSDDDQSTAAAQNSGLLTVALTDAPVDDAAEVIVVFTGIELQSGGASSINIDFDTPRSIDLLSFRDGRTTNLVEGTQVPPGRYEWIRLKVRAEQNIQDGSRILLRDGRQFPLYIPSGLETGLKLNQPFVIAQGATTQLVIDFDLRKSIVAPPGQAQNWLLRPSLRLIDRLQVGALSGAVDVAGLAAAQNVTPAACRAGIYLYRGKDVSPDDMDGDPADGMDPLVYQPLSPALPGAVVNYTLHFLGTGDYTVAATCQFDVDADPSQSEFNPAATLPPGSLPAMQFIRQNVSIMANMTTRADFPLSAAP
jgi:hypothetical protein